MKRGASEPSNSSSSSSSSNWERHHRLPVQPAQKNQYDIGPRLVLCSQHYNCTLVWMFPSLTALDPLPPRGRGANERVQRPRRAPCLFFFFSNPAPPPLNGDPNDAAQTRPKARENTLEEKGGGREKSHVPCVLHTHTDFGSWSPPCPWTGPGRQSTSAAVHRLKRERPGRPPGALFLSCRASFFPRFPLQQTNGRTNRNARTHTRMHERAEPSFSRFPRSAVWRAPLRVP